MKKQLLSRRGAAIELAIGVMLLMIAVSIVLLSLATIKHDRKKDDIAQLESKFELYEITDYIIDNPEYKGEFNGYIIDYTEEFILEKTTRTYTVTKGEEQVLSLVTEKIETGKYKITSWK